MDSADSEMAESDEPTEQTDDHEREVSTAHTGSVRTGSPSRSRLDNRFASGLEPQSRTGTPVSKARAPAVREDAVLQAAGSRLAIAQSSEAVGCGELQLPQAGEERATADAQPESPGLSPLEQQWAESGELLDVPTQPLEALNDVAAMPGNTLPSQPPLPRSGDSHAMTPVAEGAAAEAVLSSVPDVQQGRAAPLLLSAVEVEEPARPLKVRKKAKPKPKPGSLPFMDMA
mmetsp:Transcript_33758/g.95515  ORF Transcript_33758/g.95515 Transcript_33758/m.95515 type:complete len:230 (-) Transcript_33758:1210-1899(-)